MTTEPEISTLPARPYAAIAASVTMETIGAVVPPLNGEVFGWLATRGITPAGPPFWKYSVIDMARNLEVEAGCPVAGPVTGDGRVVVGVLPAGRYATLSHVGHPSTLAAATATLLDWAAARSLRWDMVPSASGERWGARLEIYRTDPKTEPDMTKWVTELAFRLAD
jgi:effector-binding domain-containing protein